jgi:hypothetical protein
MSEPLSPGDKRRIQQATQRKNHREEKNFQNRLQKKRMPALPNITSNNGKGRTQKTKFSRGIYRPRGNLDRTEGQRNDNPSQKEASRTARGRVANQGNELSEVDRQRQRNDHSLNTIEIEPSGDEQEEISEEMKSRTAQVRVANQEDKSTAGRRRNEDNIQNMMTIEIDSSGDEQESITDDIIAKPTLHNLKEEDHASVQHKGQLMRGTCVHDTK